MLERIETVAAIRSRVASRKSQSLRIGFVPTMGALHEGHLRLVERTREFADRVVVSIFVNPTQFGPSEDFNRYPRTLEEDTRRCEAAGVDLLFVPEPREIYPNGADSTFVEVPGLSSVLEGAIRPGHFRGVATVVLKLFEIVQPDVAVFGQKDFQQQLLIRRMVEDLRLAVEIRTIPTVREPDGLAMSSRNRYLDADQRQAAAVLFRALERAREAVVGGETDADRIRQILRSTVESQQGVELEYAEVADAGSLEPLRSILADGRGVALLAARVGTTRLIDNAILGIEDRECGLPF
jgi:pantoate--beta-alanine ligase